MHQRAYGIGDIVAFKDRGVSLEGRIVGAEQVGRADRNGRAPGKWFTVRVGLFEDVNVPETALGSILDAAGV